MDPSWAMCCGPQVLEHPDIVKLLRWRPDGKGMAVKALRNELYIWDFSGPDAPSVTVFQPADGIQTILGRPCYSPDGSQIAIPLRSQSTLLVNLTSGTEEYMVPPLPDEDLASRFGCVWNQDSPNALLGGGQFIMQPKSNNDLLVGSQTKGGKWAATVDITVHVSSVFFLELSPDGEWLASISEVGSPLQCAIVFHSQSSTD
eukprot:scaffold108864_cov42-Prasinocladus_malaysianus.AAC.1